MLDTKTKLWEAHIKIIIQAPTLSLTHSHMHINAHKLLLVCMYRLRIKNEERIGPTTKSKGEIEGTVADTLLTEGATRCKKEPVLPPAAGLEKNDTLEGK